MKNIKWFVSCLCLFTTNCSFQSKVLKNDFTDSRIFKRIYIEYNNAFYISHTNAHFTIWAYNNSKIYIYKIKHNKILTKNSSTYINSSWYNDYKKELLFAIDSCAELDGSILGFKIKIKDQLIKEDFAINTDCFINSVYSSEFFKELSKCVKQFKLGAF